MVTPLKPQGHIPAARESLKDALEDSRNKLGVVVPRYHHPHCLSPRKAQ